MSAYQKTGTLIPIKVTNIAKRSSQLFWYTAETTPTSTPITLEKTIASSASLSVTGKRARNSSMTGSRVMTLALALDKPMTKRVLTYHDLPTPTFQNFERVDEPLTGDMEFPLFVKPSREGTGMGISGRSIVHNEEELREQLAAIIGRYNQPALVEKYIEGREVTVGVVGNLVGPVALDGVRRGRGR